MSIFTSTPGYAGFYGPITGEAAVISFGRGGTPGDRGTTGIQTINDGFLCDQYRIVWQRPSQSKRFLNSKLPVAIVGYGNGSLTITGLVGTYEGFKKFLGFDAKAGKTVTATDICNPLYCLIQSSNNYQRCEGTEAAANDKGVNWDCYNLLLNSLDVTGQVQDNGVLFQTANISFTMGGLMPVEPAGVKKKMTTP